MEIIFIYETVNTRIIGKRNELLKDLCQAFTTKKGLEIDNLYFLYGGEIINYELTFNQQAKEEDKKNGKMNILVYSYNKTVRNENSNIIQSEEVICPKCLENCLINIKDYKISFYQCKNGHKTNNILLKDYENIQKIDQSKIICNMCKTSDKSRTFNNTFYKCFTCNNNLCPLCKSVHNNKHKIIEYDQRNYLCGIHNKKYNSYCKKCKINLCRNCEIKHLDKSNLIYYKDILPEKDIIKKHSDTLKIKINTLIDKIKDLIEILNNTINNIEIYYKISSGILKNIEKENLNYYIIKNIKEMKNFNQKIIYDINQIILNKQEINIFNDTINIYNKININNNNYILKVNKENNKQMIIKYKILKGKNKLKIKNIWNRIC